MGQRKAFYTQRIRLLLYLTDFSELVFREAISEQLFEILQFKITLVFKLFKN